MKQIHGVRSVKHDVICELIRKGIANNGIVLRSNASSSRFIELMMKEGLVERVGPGKYLLDMDRVRQVTYIIPDTLWEQLGDKEYRHSLTKPTERPDRVRAAEVKRANRHRRPASNDSFKLSDIIIGKVDK